MKRKKVYDRAYITYLGDSARLRVLDFLLSSPRGKYTVAEIACGAYLSKPTTFIQLQHFRRMGVVTRTGNGRKYFYRIKENKTLEVESTLRAIQSLLWSLFPRAL